MKLRFFIAITLSCLSFNTLVNAQYTRLFDFDRAVSGMNPYATLFSDGTYLYGSDPAFDYSIVMLLPNVETMEYASIIQRAGMLSLRENPVQTFVMNPANFLFINYQLDKVIETKL